MYFFARRQTCRSDRRAKFARWESAVPGMGFSTYGGDIFRGVQLEGSKMVLFGQLVFGVSS